MLTNAELESNTHLLRRAYELQDMIDRLHMELEGLVFEYNQIVGHVRQKGIDRQDGYAVIVKRRGVRKVDPDLFARTFPDANSILVQQQAAFMGTELDKLVQSKVLPSISVKDAEELVGKIPLERAITTSLTEKVIILPESEL